MFSYRKNIAKGEFKHEIKNPSTGASRHQWMKHVFEITYVRSSKFIKCISSVNTSCGRRKKKTLPIFRMFNMYLGQYLMLSKKKHTHTSHDRPKFKNVSPWSILGVIEKQKTCVISIATCLEAPVDGLFCRARVRIILLFSYRNSAFFFLQYKQ